MIKAVTRLFSLAFGQRAGGGKTFHPSKTCPECGSKLCADAGSEVESWNCPNLDCPAQIRARIEQWCSPGAMDIAGGDAALVAQLVGQGLARDVAELYRLRVAEIAALSGMDKNSARNFFDAITASKKREAWRVLIGLGIPQVGVEEAKSLCRHFANVDNVLAADIERLMKADGISEIVARGVVQWHSDPVNGRLVKRLDKAGVNFKSEL